MAVPVDYTTERLATSDERGVLPRRIGVWSGVAILIGSTIGSGIFRSPAGLSDKLPGPGPLLSIWVIGGLFALCGALTLAEVAGAFPQTGGVYVFIREGWGRLAAFLFGWSELVMIRAASLGAVSTTFAEYFIRVTGHDPTVAPYSAYVHYVAAAAILIAGISNYVGVRTASTVQNITTIAKVAGLVAIIVAAFAIGLPRTGGYYTPVAPPGSFSIAKFGLALVSVLWVYDGWADVSFVAGEVTNPRRNLPRVLIGGTLAIIAIYLIANMAYLAVMPIEEIRHSKLVAADVAQRVIGTGGVAFVAAVVMISTFGTLNGSMITGPRVLFAMADDGMLFSPFAKVHPRYRTPFVSISVVTIIAILFVLAGTFEQLADAFVTAIVPFYALAVASVFVLRKRPGYNPSYRVPLYPIVPALFIISTVLLLGNAIIDPSSRWATLGVLGGILIGVPVYYLTIGRRDRA
ncbi:MAG TPA: amino acid permease [Gemmatimonadaceae bacterium]|jgi:amino acid transporter|nr:amino acid permease [Gemmatimonadaceae bacterium]